MHFINTKTKGKASIYCRNNTIHEISDKFTELTGYIHDDLIGKTLEELTKILRSNVNISCREKKFPYKKYIFTNKDKPIDVEIIFNNLSEDNKEICFIKTSSNEFLEGVLATCHDIHSDDRFSEAVFSYPDLTHLKTDEQYMKRRKLFGMENTNIIGSRFLSLKNISNSIEKNGFYFGSEEKVINASGEFEYYTIKADLIYEKGKAQYLKIFFINDTEQVLERKTNAKERAEVEIILDNIPHSVIKINNKGDYVYTNKTNLDVLSSYRSNDGPLTSRETFEYFKHKDINMKRLSFEEGPASRVLRGEKISNYILIGTNNLPVSYYECNATPIYDDEGNVESAVLMYENITDTFKIEEYNELSKNIKTLEINFLTMSYKNFNIEYINDVALRLVKKIRPYIDSEEQAIGQNFFDIYTDDAKIKEETIANIDLCIKNKDNKYTQKKRVVVDGKVNYIKTIFQPIYDENNQVYRISCIGTYITDEELANQRMSESLKTQEEIFVNTSNELKTPITKSLPFNQDHNDENRIDMIKFELSDIYS